MRENWELQFVLEKCLRINECDMGISVDYYREVCHFEMFSTVSDVGVMRLPHEWKL